MQELSENKIDNSKINDFKTCPRKFFYSHVLGWRHESPNVHLVFGSAWHEAMEHLLLNGYEQISLMEAFDKFLAYWRQYFSPDQDEMFPNKNPDKAFERLAQYTGYGPYKRDLENFETLYTEIAGSISIDETRKLYFRMDGLLKNRQTGKIRSREHKTGTGAYMWQDQWLLSGQVGTYSHVLNCLYSLDEVDGIEMNGCFFPKRKSPPKPEEVFLRFLIKKQKEQMQVWLDNVLYYFMEIEREYELLSLASEDDQVLQAFPLRDTSCLNYMRRCEFHDFCMAWPNPLRRCDEPPIGFKQEFWDPTAEHAKQEFNLEKKEY